MKKNCLLILTTLVLVLSGAGGIAEEKPAGVFEDIMDNESSVIEVPPGIFDSIMAGNNTWVWGWEYFLREIVGKHGGPVQGDLAFHIMEKGKVLFWDTNSDGQKIVTIVYEGNLYECDPYHHNNLHDREGDHVFGSCFPMIHKQHPINHKSPYDEVEKADKDTAEKIGAMEKRLLCKDFPNIVACIPKPKWWPEPDICKLINCVDPLDGNWGGDQGMTMIPYRSIAEEIEKCRNNPDCDPQINVLPPQSVTINPSLRDIDKIIEIMKGGMINEK